MCERDGHLFLGPDLQPVVWSPKSQAIAQVDLSQFSKTSACVSRGTELRDRRT